MRIRIKIRMRMRMNGVWGCFSTETGQRTVVWCPDPHESEDFAQGNSGLDFALVGSRDFAGGEFHGFESE